MRADDGSRTASVRYPVDFVYRCASAAYGFAEGFKCDIEPELVAITEAVDDPRQRLASRTRLLSRSPRVEASGAAALEVGGVPSYYGQIMLKAGRRQQAVNDR